MGGGPAPQVTGTQFQNGQGQDINNWFNSVSNQGGAINQQMSSLMNSLSANPQLQTNFAQFFNPATNGYTSNFNNMGGLDARGQALVSQQQGQAQGAAAAQARANSSQLGPGNAGLANVLNRQLGAQALLGGQTAFQNASNDQVNRALNTNNSLLQGANAQAQLQQSGNNARLDQNDAANSNAALRANLLTNQNQNVQSTLASLFGTGQGMGQQYAQSPNNSSNIGHVGIAPGQINYAATPRS